MSKRTERSESFQIAVGQFFKTMRQPPSLVDLGHLISEYGDTLGQDIAAHGYGSSRSKDFGYEAARLVIYLMAAGEMLDFKLREEMELAFADMRGDRARGRNDEQPERG